MCTLKACASDLGLFWLRVFMGLGIAYHGYGIVFGGHLDRMVEGVAAMGFPLPTFFAWAAALSEFLGGICITLGLLTRPAALFVLTTMAVAAFIAHRADSFDRKELALAYGVVSCALMLLGAGKFSLDHLIQSTCKK